MCTCRIVTPANRSIRVCPLFGAIVKDMLAKNDNECKETITVLKKQNSELKNKIRDCKVRFGSGEIEDDVYFTTIEVLQNKLAKNELALSKVNQNLSNLDVKVDEIISTCCKLGSLCRKAELEFCQRIQNLLFPNGILWDKVLGSYRTIDENKALAVIQAISTSCKKEKEGKTKNFPSTLLLYAVRDSNPGPID